MANKLRRISVAVDDDTINMLTNLASKENKTISEIIRESILMYSELERVDEKIDLNKIKTYENLLGCRDHVILDLEVWIAILDELNEKASDDFWNTIANVGYTHGLHFKIGGTDSPQDILKSLELENLFEVKVEDGCFTLILASRNEQKFAKIFLENLFRGIGLEVDILEGLRKLTIVQRKRTRD